MAGEHRASADIAIYLYRAVVLVEDDALAVAYRDSAGFKCVAPRATYLREVHNERFKVVLYVFVG